MAALPTLYPVSDVVINSWRGPALDASNLWEYVDDTTAGDGDFLFTPTGDSGLLTFNLTDMPADFVTMNSLDVEIRHARGDTSAGSAGAGDDTWTFVLEVTDATGSTFLCNNITVESSTQGWATKTEVISLTVNTTADKATWDGARVTMNADLTTSMGNDGHRIWLDFVRFINGDYDADAGGGGTTFSGWWGYDQGW